MEGNKVNYDFEVEEFTDIVGYFMEIDFKNSGLSFSEGLEKDLNSISNDFFAAVNDEGVLKTLWYDSENGLEHTLNDFEKIFRVAFTGNGDLNSASINLASESTNGNRLRSGAKLKFKSYAMDKNGCPSNNSEKCIKRNDTLFKCNTKSF